MEKDNDFEQNIDEEVDALQINMGHELNGIICLNCLDPVIFKLIINSK